MKNENRLVRQYVSDPLQELLVMCRYAKSDIESAYYRQLRFLRELENWNFNEQPGFESLHTEILLFKEAMEHNNELIDKIYKRLRTINDAMILDEKEPAMFFAPVDSAIGESDLDYKTAIVDIERFFVSLNSDNFNLNKTLKDE